MNIKKIFAGFMMGCLLITSTHQAQAKGRLKRVLAGSFLGSIAGGALGFGIGVVSVIGAGVCCPCCIFIPVIGSCVLGIGTGAVSGGVVGAVTAKDGTEIKDAAKKKKKSKKNKKVKKALSRRLSTPQKNN